MTMANHARVELIEHIEDLEHDLGKYLLLPLAMLPHDASSKMVVDAALQGLLRTRSHNGQSQTALELFEQFQRVFEAQCEPLSHWQSLVEAMKVAWAWHKKLQDGEVVVARKAIESDFRAVGQAIRRLKAEV